MTRENPKKPHSNSAKYAIDYPLSGNSRHISLRLPTEIIELVQARAGRNITTVTGEIRAMLVDHLRNVGIMPPNGKDTAA